MEETSKLNIVDDKSDSSNDAPTKTRHDLQLGRRLFHFLNGLAMATAYKYFFTHTRIVSILGTIACTAYIFEQVRVAYPELFKKFSWFTNLFLRAEEELKESSMIPYAMAILLSILTFPKPYALIAIYTLAIADPLSAIIGIRFGKHRIVSHKTLEGSGAFFVATFFICFFILYSGETDFFWVTVGTSSLIALLASIFEMLPIKLDDNLTIPLVVGFMAWICASLFF